MVLVQQRQPQCLFLSEYMNVPVVHLLFCLTSGVHCCTVLKTPRVTWERHW